MKHSPSCRAMLASNHHKTRRAFTLLEIVLVLVLVATLALAVYQASIVHVGLAEAGRRKATHAQLLRGVVGQVQLDMRTVFTGWQAVSRDAASPSGAIPDDGTETLPDDNALSNAGEPLSEYEVPGGGVLGFEDAITLVVRRSTLGLDFTPNLAPDPSAKPNTDLRLIRYWFGSPGVDTAEEEFGLVRQEIDYVPDVTAGDDPAAGARTEVIAQEVRSVQFQYFDGSAWYAEWDQTRESSPVAIQVTLGIARPPINQLMADSQTEQIEYVRIVVAPTDVEPPAESDADGSTPISTDSEPEPLPSAEESLPDDAPPELPDAAPLEGSEDLP